MQPCATLLQTQTTDFVEWCRGSVTCIVCAIGKPDFEVASGLTVSASADSTIKLWDPKLGVQETSVCVQTLVGHAGTITAVVVKAKFLVSCSTDCTVRLWRAAEGRSMLAYPWFEQQVSLLCGNGPLNYDYHSPVMAILFCHPIILVTCVSFTSHGLIGLNPTSCL